jgi:hypothetical protein
MRARMAITQMRMRRKKRWKPMMDQHRLWRPEGIVCLTWEPVMSTGMSVNMATMPMWMRRNKHLKPVMDQCRMWRTEGIVVESVMIGLYFSDL